METEQSSGSNSNSNSNSSGGDIWAKLVSSDSSYSDIELRLTDEKICSETRSSSCEKREWCKITRENDQNSASLQNKSDNPIIVDGMAVQENDAAIIKCGSEIILGPEADGFRRYKFKVMPTEEILEKPLKIIMDPENAKCSICLSVWHDVVTVSPCLHNFWYATQISSLNQHSSFDLLNYIIKIIYSNGCFSKWSERCQKKLSSVACPQCRAVVEFVGRNHFLHSIEEDILKSDSSLRRSDEEIAVLDSYSSIKLPLVTDAYSSSLEHREYFVRVEQRFAHMEMMVRRLASHANVDFSDFDCFRPPPFPNTEPMDTDDEDEHTEEDEEEHMYNEEEEHTDNDDEEEEHTDNDDEEEHTDNDDEEEEHTDNEEEEHMDDDE